MYIVAIAWLYVALMMAVAEGTNTTGSVLGAIITFVLYGILPVALVIYLMGHPGRRKARLKKEAQAQADASGPQAASVGVPAPVAGSGAPDQPGHAATDTVAPVRKEP